MLCKTARISSSRSCLNWSSALAKRVVAEPLSQSRLFSEWMAAISDTRYASSSVKKAGTQDLCGLPPTHRRNPGRVRLRRNGLGMDPHSEYFHLTVHKCAKGVCSIKHTRLCRRATQSCSHQHFQSVAVLRIVPQMVKMASVTEGCSSAVNSSR